MADFYYVEPCKYSPFYAELDVKKIPDEFQMACCSSSFQLIDPKTPITLKLTEESPENFPDLLYMGSIPLVSDYMKSLFDDFGIDNILYKRVILEHPISLNQHECWLALPSTIPCLNYEESEFIEGDKFGKLDLLERRIGRYDIFKITNTTEKIAVIKNKIILTEKLYNYLMNVPKALEGVYIKSLIKFKEGIYIIE